MLAGQDKGAVAGKEPYVQPPASLDAEGKQFRSPLLEVPTTVEPSPPLYELNKNVSRTSLVIVGVLTWVALAAITIAVSALVFIL